MSIQFACACGQNLAAREEHAGKRVKCTACGEIQTVPGGPRELPPERATTPELIQFHCSCGQICQARPEFAGRNTRCPRCSTVLTIPAAGITGAAPAVARPASLQAEPPVARVSSRRPVEDEDEADDLENRPRQRRRSTKKSKAWIWIAVAAGLLLVGGGIGLWLLLRGGIDSDFDLVPRDAQGFVTIRVADALDSPLGTKMMDKFGKGQLDQLAEIGKKAGLSSKDIERITVVLLNIDKKEVWGIIQTKKAYEKEKILAAAREEGKLEEKSHDGKQYYQLSSDNSAFCFYSSNIIVYAPSAKLLEKCLDLPKKPKSGPLDDALEAASKRRNQFAAGFNVPSDLVGPLRNQLPKEAKPFKPLLNVKSGYMTMSITKDIEFELSAAFSDKDQAKEAESAIGDLVSTARLGLTVLEAQGGGGPDAANVKAGLSITKKILDQIKPRQSGKTVSVSAKIEGSDFLDLVEMGVKQGLNRFGP